MAAIDPEYERHRRTWLGFTWFVKIGMTLVILVLGLMAIFLL